MKFLALLLLAIALPGAAPVHAQSWPAKPIRFIVSFAPGGVHDNLARVLAPALQEALGQPIVVDNRPGAGGNIAAELVARSAPDGYTFLVASEALPTNKYLYRTLSYDPERELAPVTKLADFPMLLVANPALAANSLAELVAFARARPGEIHFGSAGIGTAGHLSGELLKSVAENGETVNSRTIVGERSLTEIALPAAKAARSEPLIDSDQSGCSQLACFPVGAGVERET